MQKATVSLEAKVVQFFQDAPMESAASILNIVKYTVARRRAAEADRAAKMAAGSKPKVRRKRGPNKPKVGQPNGAPGLLTVENVPEVTAAAV